MGSGRALRELAECVGHTGLSVIGRDLVEHRQAAVAELAGRGALGIGQLNRRENAAPRGSRPGMP